MTNKAFKVKFGLDVGDTVASIDGTTGNIVTQGDAAINGGDLTTTSTTANIVNTTATTVNIGGDATTTNIGKSLSGKVIIGNDLQITGNDILTGDGTTALTFTNVTGDVDVTGDLRVVGGDLITSQATSSLFNTTATTLSIGGAATTISIGANTGTTTVNNDLVADSFSGAGGTFGNVTVGVATDQTVSTTSGDLVLDSATGIITLNSLGTTGVTLTPITSQIPYTLFAGNMIKGAIRDATTLAAGNMFSFSNGTGGPTRGLSIDNSATGSTTQRPGIVLRAYGGGLGGGNPVASFISETARGSAAVPAGLSSGNGLGSWFGSGYADTSVGGASPGWVSDTTGNIPVSLGFITTEAWTSGTTNLGTQCSIRTNPTGSGNAIQTSMAINPQSTISRSDAFTWQNGKTGTTQTMALDVSGNLTLTGDLRVNGNDIQASDGLTNITLTSNTLTSFAGDLRVNGNDIQASDGLTNITLTSNTLTSFAGDIRVNGGDIQNPGGTSAITLTTSNATTTIVGDQVNVNNNSGTGGARLLMGGTGSVGGSYVSIGDVNIAQMSSSWQSALSPGFKYTGLMSDSTLTGTGSYFEMSSRWKASAGTATYAPPQNTWGLGRFGFSADNSTTGTNQVNAGAIQSKATENWTSTATGSSLNFSANKAGVASNSVEVLNLSPENAYVQSDNIILSNSSFTQLTGNKIQYNRVYGQWQHDATITPAAANTAYAVPFQGVNSVTDFANIATASNTSEIRPNALGMYKLQFSAQVENADVGQDHQITFWWRKNGTNISNSAGYFTVPKAGAASGALIVGWDNVVEVTTITDYYQLMYAVSDTDVTLPFIAASAPRPGAAAVFLTLVPIGA